MYHDFTDGDSRNERFSSKFPWIPCTNVGGYMDYRLSPNKWSDCSVEDFTEYYNSVDSWCLAPRQLGIG